MKLRDDGTSNIFFLSLIERLNVLPPIKRSECYLDIMGTHHSFSVASGLLVDLVQKAHPQNLSVRIVCFYIYSRPSYSFCISFNITVSKA